MNGLGDLYMQIGAVGFALIIAGVASWRLGEIGTLLAKKKLNGRLAYDGPDKDQWSKLAREVSEVHAHDRDVTKAIDKGQFSCQWSQSSISALEKNLSELCTEIKLLRLEVELSRKHENKG